MAIGPVSTPLRRSKRGQPIVAVSADTLDSDAPLNLPEPVFKRTTRSEDLYQEDIEALNRRDVSIEDLETHFYDRLSMRMHGVKRTLKTYGKSQRDRSSNVAAEDIYKIGDAVLVKSAARDPSVAVVVAIWNIVGPEVQQSVRVLLHWFLRPSELAGIRAARKHEEVKNPSIFTNRAIAKLHPVERNILLSTFHRSRTCLVPCIKMYHRDVLWRSS